MHRGRMSWRRLRVLIQHLPPESHTMTALRNGLSDEQLAEQADQGEPEKGRWSQSEQLLAAVVDGLRRLEYITVLANSDGKGKKPDLPQPIRRPGAKAPRPKGAMSDVTAQWLFEITRDRAA